jgi:N-acyl homoserine lactone hydrolase
MTVIGTPKRLYLLRLSTSDVPMPDGRILPMVLVCYLVQTTEGQNILIDTGLIPEAQPQPGSPPRENVKNVLEHLTDLGLTPGDIHMVICTHFDPDHAGYHDAFPGAEFVIQKAHYDIAKSGHPRYKPAQPHWDHAGLDYRTVEGDTEIIPGLTLIETSGHAPGHQSVLVRLPNTGAVILAIDAVSQGSQFNVERIATRMDDNEELLRASTQKLLDLAQSEHAAFVVFGHDGGQWKTLKIAPEFYD